MLGMILDPHYLMLLMLLIPPNRHYGWGHGGALVTTDFIDGMLNNKEGLDACNEFVL